jgi:ribosomal protein L11 methyltransferase
LPLFRATTAVHGEPAAQALSEALDALDPAPLASEVHDHDDGSGLWDAGGLFGGPPDPAGLALIARLHGAPDFAVSRVEDRDWVAQVRSELTPVAAGRFLVYGSHDRGRVPPGRIGLEIEAAEAFGTGHHASTQGCLTALDRLVRAGRVMRRVADIGGGTGVLAMAAVSVWPATAVVGDIDPVATATAKANAAANGLGARIRCVTAAGFGHPLVHRGAPYELIFANILAAPLKRLAPGFAAHRCPAGYAILSGILARQAPGVVAVFRGWGWVPERPVRIGEWTTLVLRRA